MHEKKIPILYSLLSLAVIVALLGLLVRAILAMDYEWSFGFLLPYLWENGAPGILLRGLWGTLYISLLSITFGTILGVFLGILFSSREPVARWAVLIYVDIFRNTPVLVQLYVAYFVLGTMFNLTAEQAGVITLSLFCAAYIADLVRGTVANFEKGQLDAAKSLGMSTLQIAWFIQTPQMLRRMLPPLVGQFVTLVKDSALVSVIGILELTKAALNVVSVSFRSFEVWFLVALLYFVVNIVLSTFGRYLEHRLSASLR